MMSQSHAYDAWCTSNATNNNLPDPNDPDNIFEKVPAADYSQMNYTKVQHRRYVCGACGQNVTEESLDKHHSDEHADILFTVDMYELFEIDECIECLICNVEMFEQDFKEHVDKFHTDYNTLDDPWQSTQNTESDSAAFSPSPDFYTGAPLFDWRHRPAATVNVKDRFRCMVCGAANILASNITRHHSKIHSHIPKNVNIFVQEPDVFVPEPTYFRTKPGRVRCDICGKMVAEKRSQKHQMKSHQNKFEHQKENESAAAEDNKKSNKMVEGFRNICISHEEFERLLGRNRIYEVNGRHYLKDSE